MTDFLLAIIGGMATVVSAVLSVLVAKLITKLGEMEKCITHFDIRLSKFVTRDELELKLDKTRVEIDQQILRQDDRITKRIDFLVKGYEEMRVWLTEHFATISQAIGAKEDKH